MKELSINIVTYAPLLFTLLVSVWLMLSFKRKFKQDKLSVQEAKRDYSWAIFICGWFSGLIVMLGLFTAFHLNNGHGLMTMMLVVMNVFFSWFMILLGRMIIAWEDIIY